MNISIVGYGRMGNLVEEVAKEKGITVVSTIDPNVSSARYKNISEESLGQSDVCVCFTQPNAALSNIENIAKLGKDIVVGTTGWHADVDEAKDIVSKYNIGLIYSENFSVGVNVFYKMIEQTASLINKFDGYDIFVHEFHHKGKLDSPSGTANNIGEILLSNIKRKKSIVTEKLDRQILPEEIHVASVRGGYVPGHHAVSYDSEVDTISITHQARSRKGFAVGSAMAAQWICGKKGFYTKDDMLVDLLN